MNQPDTREHVRHLPRIFWIDYEIRAGRYPNATTIAAHFEISTKTAQRTLEYLRDQIRMPLAFSHAENGYYYSEPHATLPAVSLSEGELVAVLLADQLVAQSHGLALDEALPVAIQKILSALTDTLTVDLQALAEAHSFEAAPVIPLSVATRTQLALAIHQRRSVKMTYYTAMRGVSGERTVNPLHLRNYQGEWYLIAWDHGRQAVRDFHAARISALLVTDEEFIWPTGFALHDYLAASFGMHRGDQVYRVELIFDEYQSRWMRQRGKFHPTETREELPDGRLRMQMTVTALDGVQRFVLQYGVHVEVIQPPELRAQVASALQQALAIYETRQESSV